MLEVSNVKCQKCSHENRTGAKFCEECGAAMELLCPNCGQVLKPTAKFCDDCGSKIGDEGERRTSLEDQFDKMQEGLPMTFKEQLAVQADGENRIVTVMLADMSSSVQATKDLDPEDAANLVSRLLKTMIDVLSKYECRIDNIVGDEIVAVFGAPKIHENDPERAITAGFEIIEAVQSLELNASVGINTGEAFFGEIGSEEHQKKTVYGTVINLAARFQGAANAGTIIVGEATYRHTKRAFEFEPLQLEVKGFNEPVTAFRALRSLPKPDKVRGIEGIRADLVGRDEEFGKLKDALDEVLQGRGQIVTLIGEAGVGKSRLVAELKNLALKTDEESMPIWLEGRCLELGMTASYWPFVDVFHDYFGWGLQDSEKSRAKSVINLLEQFVELGHITDQQSENMGSLLGRLLSVQFGTEWDERFRYASPDQIQHQTFLAIHDVLVALSKQRPLVLALEDLHWSDSLSLDLVSLLMEALRLGSILLLCVYRPEREHKCWHIPIIAQRKCPDRYMEIRLTELTPNHSRQMVESLLTINKLPDSTKELILEKSQGNPFFVEEVVRSLIDSGMVYREEGAWHARQEVETVGVPDTLQSVILGRVDRLQEDLRSILQSASVIGRLFRSRVLSHITRQGADLEEKLLELEDAALIYQERALPEREYSFKHVLTQEAVYQNILRQKRTLFHREVAEAMVALYEDSLDEYCDQLAFHYEKSDDAEKALQYLLMAAQKAQRAYSNETAIEYFSRALAQLDSMEPKLQSGLARFEALVGTGKTLVVIGRVQEGEKRLGQATAVGEEMKLSPAELIPAYDVLCSALFYQNKDDEEDAIVEKSLALIGNNEESLHAAVAYRLSAWVYARKGDKTKWKELVFRIKGFVLKLPQSSALCDYYKSIARVYQYEKNAVEAAKWLEIAERTARVDNDLATLAGSLLIKGDLLAAQGHIVGALKEFRPALSHAREAGHARFEVVARNFIVECLIQLGDLEQARVFSRTNDNISHLESWETGSWTRINAAMLVICQGSSKTAEEMLRHIVKSYEYSREMQIIFGHVLLALGKSDEAVLAFKKAAALLSKDAHIRWNNNRQVIETMSGLENASADPKKFRALLPSLIGSDQGKKGSSSVSWFLDSAEREEFSEEILKESFSTKTLPDWTWEDPFNDCQLSAQDGCVIHAANGRDLWGINQSAPRLTRQVEGDFAAQTIVGPNLPDRPAMGGILIWHDRLNYIYLARGIFGDCDLCFMGSIESEDVIVGRGRLESERTFLRLERQRNTVSALCSADGKEWFAAGDVEFAVDDPVSVGVVAMGDINRAVYPGDFTEGGAIRFELFDLWGK